MYVYLYVCLYGRDREEKKDQAYKGDLVVIYQGAKRCISRVSTFSDSKQKDRLVEIAGVNKFMKHTLLQVVEERKLPV